MSSSRIITAAAAALLTIALGGCSDGSSAHRTDARLAVPPPTPSASKITDTPAASPDLRSLGTAKMPQEAKSFPAMLAKMPSVVAGEKRADPKEIGAPVSAGWGTGRRQVLFMAAPVEVAGLPGMTSTQLMTRLDKSGDMAVTDRNLDPSHGMLYLLGTSTVSGEKRSQLIWAAPTGNWMYVAEAPDSGALRELVSAITAVARSS